MYIWMIWMICICIYVVLLGFQTPRPLPYCSIWPDVWWLYIPRPGLGWNARTTEVLHSSSLWSWTFTFCQGIPRHKRTAGSSMAENIYSPTLSRTRGADFFWGWDLGGGGTTECMFTSLLLLLLLLERKIKSKLKREAVFDKTLGSLGYTGIGTESTVANNIKDKRYNRKILVLLLLLKSYYHYHRHSHFWQLLKLCGVVPKHSLYRPF